MPAAPAIPEHNRQVVLAAYPDGDPRPEDFALVRESPPEPVVGRFLVRNRWLSVDPMVRLFIDRTPMGAIPQMPLGTTIPGAAAGEVIASQHPDYAVGDVVEGRFGWQDIASSDGAGVHRVEPAMGPVENALGIFGLPGFSAYVGLEVAGGVEFGRTVVVSGAAGAVGSVAGALAKARGARVVGIASGSAKRAWLTHDIGYDAVVDRTAPDFEQALAAALPEGADLYFDNVGVPLMMQVVPHMNRNGTVLICGLMGQYSGIEAPSPDALAPFLTALMGKSLKVQAFVNVAHEALRPAFIAAMTELATQRPALARVHVSDGLEQTPHAFAALFTSTVAGKRLVRL